jgi:copper homeostasis protein
MQLEVCVTSVQNAVIAQAAGADRIELCSNLDRGGITPQRHEIESARRLLNIPFHVMIRCRPGNFFYSEHEIAVMEDQTRIAKSLGADGIVFGSLLEDGTVDSESLIRIVNAASPLPVTFHRAFDECNDPFVSIMAIIKSRCSTLLTSGQKAFAWQGLPLIKELQIQFGNKIEIMPGSGITDINAEEIIRYTGVRWIHASARINSADGKTISKHMIRNIQAALLKLKNC